MARKTVGYEELEWICPNCRGKNPGPQKTCLNCGSPQPENVKFQQREKQELLAAEDKIAKAEAGADIHCAYCGTRNPAGAKVCSQCDADLTQGKQRESGQVIGAFKEGEEKQIACPACGALNPSSALKCSQCGSSLAKEAGKPPATTPQPPKKGCLYAIIGGVALLLIAGIFLIIALTQTSASDGVVKSVEWQRAIVIEEFSPVTKEDWNDEIPSGGEIQSCSEQLYDTQDSPVAGAKEVCGEPYSVDKGSGYAEVVQDCQYEVYKDYCKYTVDDWHAVDKAQQNGADLNAVWPSPQLNQNQRLGEEQEDYAVFFSTGKGDLKYTTTDYSLFTKCQTGSRWTLNINQLGAIVSIEQK